MGIPRLTDFIEKKFTGWEVKVINGKLVIDGGSLIYHLYRELDWANGGQYPQFRKVILEFFQTLMKSDIYPMVVLDGVDYKQEKKSTTLERRRRTIKYVHSRLYSRHHQEFEYRENVLPILGYKVFKETLLEMSVPLVVVDGEADVAVYQLANHYSCPVLASDSDYYMFNLKGGYIPINRLELGKASDREMKVGEIKAGEIKRGPVTAKVFHVRAFVKQFQYKAADASVRLIIPAIVGNDFLSSCRSPELDAHISKEIPVCPDQHPLLAVVQYAGQFTTLEKFSSHISSIEQITHSEGLSSNCRKAEELYDSKVTKSFDQLRALETTELHKYTGERIPEWLLGEFRDGHLSSFVMNSLVLGKCIPRIAVDDTWSDSVHVVSQPLRQFIYGLIGVGPVVEHLRKEKDLVDVRVDAIRSLNDQPLPTLEQVTKLDPVARKDLLYSMLGCNPMEIEKLPEKWRLVIVSVVFWAVTKRVSQRNWKALLCSMTLCSSETADQLKDRIQSMCLGARPRREWIAAVYSFSQWQSCYLAVANLNVLLMKPFECVSPAFLFDGHMDVYMYFSSDKPALTIRKKTPARDIQRWLKFCDAVLAHTGSHHERQAPWATKSFARHRKAAGHGHGLRHLVLGHDHLVYKERYAKVERKKEKRQRYN